MPRLHAAMRNIVMALPLFSLPAAALARPVTVVTHSTGMTYANQSALEAFVPHNAIPDEIPLPFELTLSSTFDWTGRLPAREEWAGQADSDIVIDFRLGDLAWHYAGTGSSQAVLYTPSFSGGDAYQHRIWLDASPASHGYDLEFEQRLIGPGGSMGPGGALAPGAIDGAGMNGRFRFTAYRSNDEYSFSYPMNGNASTFSLRITSPVPEPAPAGMLAAGLLALSLHARARQRRTHA